MRAVAGEGAVVSREGASGASCAPASAIAPSDASAFADEPALQVRLLLPHARVGAAGFDELGMGRRLHHAPVLEHVDAVGFRERAETMRHHDDGARARKSSSMSLMMAFSLSASMLDVASSNTYTGAS